MQDSADHLSGAERDHIGGNVHSAPSKGTATLIDNPAFFMEALLQKERYSFVMLNGDLTHTFCGGNAVVKAFQIPLAEFKSPGRFQTQVAAWRDEQHAL